MKTLFQKTHSLNKLWKRDLSSTQFNFINTFKLLSTESHNSFGHKRQNYLIRDFSKCSQTYSNLNSKSTESYADFVVLGGGVMGSSVAYWLKQRYPNQLSCSVIEKDCTYAKCSTTLSAGGIRQQFSIKENIQLSLFSSKFLQNIDKYLRVIDKDLPNINLHLNGYLVVSKESGVEQLIQNHKLQTEFGAKMQLLSSDQLKAKFEWINAKDIALASLGVENEGWFDPWALLMAFKIKAQSLGVNYITSEVIGFNLKNMGPKDSTGSDAQSCNEVIVRQTDGSLKSIRFGTAIVCCGAQSGQIAKYLGYESHNIGVRSVELPIEPRKRYIFVIHCPSGPGPQMPMILDSSPVYIRPEGTDDIYLCSRCPDKGDEPSITDLEVDYSFFDRDIWPLLAHRVQAFESIKVRQSWAGFYDYNSLDQNPVIGKDPYYENIYWAAGFSGHGIQQAPALGRAVMELLFDNKYQTIDLSRFGWNRILKNEPILELNVY